MAQIWEDGTVEKKGSTPTDRPQVKKTRMAHEEEEFCSYKWGSGERKER